MVLILLLGTSLRLFRLDAQSVWFDEAARLIIARNDILTIMQSTGGDTLPPLYHLSLHFWQLLGRQDFWTRLPSVFANILLIAAMFQLGTMLFDKRVGVFAAGITAVLPYLIFHSQQANLYSQFVLLAALQIIFFWQIYQGKTGKMTWAAYVFINLAALYTHYFAAFLLIATHLFLLSKKTVPRKIILADVAILIGYLPYLNIFLGKAQEVSSGFWLNAPSLLDPFLTLFLFIGSYSVAGTGFIIGLVLVMVLVTFSLLEIRYHARRKPSTRPIVTFLLLITFSPIVIVWIISQWLPIYLDRTLLIILPGYVLLLAYALANAQKRSPLPIIGLLTLGLISLSLYNYYELPEYWKPNYRAAATAVAASHSAENAIVHTSNGSYIPFLVYLPPQNHFLLAGDPAPHHPAKVHENVNGATIDWSKLNQYDTVTVVIALDHSIEYQKEMAARFDNSFPLLNSIEIDEIIIRTYATSQ